MSILLISIIKIMNTYGLWVKISKNPKSYINFKGKNGKIYHNCVHSEERFLIIQNADVALTSNNQIDEV